MSQVCFYRGVRSCSACSALGSWAQSNDAALAARGSRARHAHRTHIDERNLPGERGDLLCLVVLFVNGLVNGSTAAVVV